MPMRPDIDEALRYLGVRSDPNGTLHTQMAGMAEELCTRITPRSMWCVLPVTRENDMLSLGGIPLPGSSAARMLADCQQAAVLVCTLGAAFDLLLHRTQARDMTRAVMLDALGSAYVEAACHAAEQEIAARFPGMYLTDRFSPGYGDLPLEVQPRLLDAAQAQRIGVTAAPSLMMIPQKSVSALIGLADRPQMSRIRGCAFCQMKKTCTLRKAGNTCGF